MAEKIYNICNRAVEYLFYILLALTPFVFTPSTSELFEFPKIIFVYILTTLIVFFWVTKSILAGKLIFRRTILDIPLVLFLLSITLSTITSVDHHTSFWGYYGRWNGSSLSIICYLLLYWAYVSNMTREGTVRAIRFLLASATIVSLYAIAEHFGHSYSCLVLRGHFDTSCWVPKVQERVFASLGQPNWLAAWLVAIVPLSVVLSLPYIPVSSHKLPYTRALGLITSALILTAILSTKSRSGFIGLAGAFAIFIFLLLPKKFLVGASWAVLLLFATSFLWQKVLSDCFDLNPNTLVTSAGTESCKIRAIVWKGALDIWKHYPIFGSGVETFAYTYYNFRPAQHNLTSEWDLLYNRAHNEYLNYLATAGIVGLSTYLLLIGTFLLWATRNLRTHPNLPNFAYLIALLAGYTSILVTNFFGFSVVVTSLLFFLLPAMSISLTSLTSPNFPKLSLTPPKILISFLAFCSLLFVLFKIAGYFEADQLYAAAKKENSESSPKTAIKKLEKALSLHGEPKYYDELADSTSRIASTLAEDSPRAENGALSEAEGFASLSKDLSNQALSISPRNVSFWSSRAIYFKRLAGIDRKYLEQAVAALEQAVRLAPTDPTFRYNLGVLYSKAGDKQKAVKTIKEAIVLKPNYQEAQDALNELSP